MLSISTVGVFNIERDGGATFDSRDEEVGDWLNICRGVSKVPT
jgi:hypothetical protein